MAAPRIRRAEPIRPGRSRRRYRGEKVVDDGEPVDKRLDRAVRVHRARKRKPPPARAGAAPARLRGIGPGKSSPNGVMPRLPCNGSAVDVITEPARHRPHFSYARVVYTAAAFLDLDKTLISTSCTLAFGRPFLRGGLISRTDALAAAYAQMRYRASGLSAEQLDRMRDRICARCQGWDVADVQEIVEQHLPSILPAILYPDATNLIESHRRAGHEIVIVSSSGQELVAPIGAMLGADRVIATRLTVTDGRYSGDIDFYAVGAQKVTAIRAAAAGAGYDLAECYAYSDSVIDVPMLEAVGHPWAVNPDRRLRRIARERNWPVLRFRLPRGRAARRP